MKQLDRLTNNNKGKLLHELMPDEIPDLLEYFIMVSSKIEVQKEKLETEWKDGFMPFGTWYMLSQHVKSTIEKHNKKLHKSAGLFSDQLFDGYNALFAVHCVTAYVENAIDGDPKFKQLVSLLF